MDSQSTNPCTRVGCTNTDTVQCEYVWRSTDRWIDFPWSVRSPVGEELAGTPGAER